MDEQKALTARFEVWRIERVVSEIVNDIRQRSTFIWVGWIYIPLAYIAENHPLKEGKSQKPPFYYYRKYLILLDQECEKWGFSTASLRQQKASADRNARRLQKWRCIDHQIYRLVDLFERYALTRNQWGCVEVVQVCLTRMLDRIWAFLLTIYKEPCVVFCLFHVVPHKWSKCYPQIRVISFNSSLVGVYPLPWVCVAIDSAICLIKLLFCRM